MSGAVGVILLAAAAPMAHASDRVLRADLTIAAPVAEVWKAWTTDAGIASFFAPKGHVVLEVDGTYDVWFNPEGKPGERGAEGMRILDVEPMKRFVFTWNAPPSIPAIRGKRTVVTIELASAGPRTTKLRFTHGGWGDGPDWDKAYDYFDRAWGSIVLPRLQHRFEHGPLDWTQAPPPVASARSLKCSLSEAAR